jgi:hypothetical protein
VSIPRKIDYGPVREEYISSEVSIRKLAAKYGVSFGSLAERSRNEGWLQLRQAHGRQVAARTYEGMAMQIAEQERAIRLEQIAVLRATLHEYATNLKNHKVMVTAKDMVATVQALDALLSGGITRGDADDATPNPEIINVTPGADVDFWRRLVEHARDRVAPTGSVGAASVSGAPGPRPN